MKVLVDENIPNISVRELRLMGYDVLDIRRTEKEGLFDDELWTLAQTEQRLLITTDKGFFEHREEPHFGILIVRLHQPNEQRIHARIMKALEQFPSTGWGGLLVAMRDTVQSIYRSGK
jgi:uncharacterized protein with PIN domain